MTNAEEDMHIQDLNSYNPSSKGLYFTKISSVLFNKNAKYITQEPVKTSEKGIRYIENTEIPKNIKDRFLKIPFIKELSENFDTFIFFREIPKGHRNNFLKEHIACTKISWADFSKEYAQVRRVDGHSPVSEDLALEKMFKNLEQENFSALY